METLFQRARSAVAPKDFTFRAFLLAISAATVPTLAAAAPAPAPSQTVEGRYVQERARCLNGTSNQDKATCLKEAGAAREEAMRSRLDEKGANYKSDAMVRCGALSGGEAKDCMARVRGADSTTTSTTTSGSVQSGGMVQETRTLVRPSGAASGASSSH